MSELMNKIIKLPCKIGDYVYVVEDADRREKHYETIYGGKIKINKYSVEAFIIDDEGISIAENGWGGYNKFGTYHDLTLKEHGEPKIFFNEADAIEFVKSVIKNKESLVMFDF